MPNLISRLTQGIDTLNAACKEAQTLFETAYSIGGVSSPHYAVTAKIELEAWADKAKIKGKPTANVIFPSKENDSAHHKLHVASVKDVWNKTHETLLSNVNTALKALLDLLFPQSDDDNVPMGYAAIRLRMERKWVSVSTGWSRQSRYNHITHDIAGHQLWLPEENDVLLHALLSLHELHHAPDPNKDGLVWHVHASVLDENDVAFVSDKNPAHDPRDAVLRAAASGIPSLLNPNRVSNLRVYQKSPLCLNGDVLAPMRAKYGL